MAHLWRDDCEHLLRILKRHIARSRKAEKISPASASILLSLHWRTQCRISRNRSKKQMRKLLVNTGLVVLGLSTWPHAWADTAKPCKTCSTAEKPGYEAGAVDKR